MARDVRKMKVLAGTVTSDSLQKFSPLFKIIVH